ncbi:MAG: aldose 1-epimerase family protein [Desulfobacter sp.]
MDDATLLLSKDFFTEKKKRIFESGAFYADAFVYPSGIQALTLGNSRGYIVVLPYMGQMIWDAVFDGVDLTMKNMFSHPRPSREIVETYGCYMYHSGMLRSGCPGPGDDHPLHGEMPCAPMDTAALVFGRDDQGPFMGISGTYEYVMGFGDHYQARPRVVLRQDTALMDIAMAVENLAGQDMELMYMCHMNPAFAVDSHIIQPAPHTPDHVVTRTSIPGHVTPTPEWEAFLNQVAADPGLMAVLDQPHNYDPEFVFFLKGLAADDKGFIPVLMKQPDQNAFYVSYDSNAFSHLVRWILCSPDQQVAAFALPATCEPEGYTREKEKGNIRTLAPGETQTFRVRAGLLSPEETGPVETMIRSLI